MAEAAITLALMRGGAPNSEILMAKGVAELLAIAERHGIKLPRAESESPAKERETPVRRDTSPHTSPHTLEGAKLHTSHALSRARAWRYQHMAALAEAEIRAGMENGPATAQLAACEEATAEALDAERNAGVFNGPAAAEFDAVQAATQRVVAATHRVRAVAEAATGHHLPHTTPLPSSTPGELSNVNDQGTYYGDYDEDGARCGHGLCQYASGVEYEGEWRLNLPEGRGRIYYPSGEIFEGNFANGVREGSGTFAYADGRVEVAVFRRGLNARGEGAMWSPRRTTAWRIVKDGEEVEEISIPESWAVASRVGEPVPGRLWREERLERGAIE